ncbi:MAG: PaaI family thioesterase [Deltaproteobacteria bacterium]|nr:PaaI family thioesterase [Deltaproteobacteria bacterium]
MHISTEQMAQINDNPLYRTIGLRAVSATEGRVVSELLPHDNVCWPFPGQPHGGILFTQMDSTMAWAVLTAYGEESSCTTVNLEIQYPSPAQGPIFTCEATVAHRTGRTCFVRGESRDEEGRLVAMGQGTFRIIKVKPHW